MSERSLRISSRSSSGATLLGHGLVTNAAYAVGPQGVFHMGCEAGKGETVGRRPVWLRDAAGHDREIATVELPPGANFLGLSATPDGSSIVYATGAFTTNVMMIENFQ